MVLGRVVETIQGMNAAEREQLLKNMVQRMEEDPAGLVNEPDEFFLIVTGLMDIDEPRNSETSYDNLTQDEREKAVMEFLKQNPNQHFRAEELWAAVFMRPLNGELSRNVLQNLQRKDQIKWILNPDHRISLHPLLKPTR